MDAEELLVTSADDACAMEDGGGLHDEETPTDEGADALLLEDAACDVEDTLTAEDGEEVPADVEDPTPDDDEEDDEDDEESSVLVGQPSRRLPAHIHAVPNRKLVIRHNYQGAGQAAPVGGT